MLCSLAAMLFSSPLSDISTSDNETKRAFSLSELPSRDVFCHPSLFSGADVIVFKQNQLKQNDEDESWLCKHTCPPLRFLAFSYSSSIWEVKGWKSGMTNLLRKAWVSRTMLLWTHLTNKPQTACNTLWLHASGRKSLSTKCVTVKSDKLQWCLMTKFITHSDQLLLSTMASGRDEWLWWVCDRHVWDILRGSVLMLTIRYLLTTICSGSTEDRATATLLTFNRNTECVIWTGQNVL